MIAVVRRQGVEARAKAGEGLGFGRLVAGEQGIRHLVVHALDMGDVFGETEGGGVAVEVGQGLVDLGVGLEHTRRLGDLGGLRLRRLDAAVELAPGRGRQAGANGRAVAGGQVALRPRHVVQNLVGLLEQLNELGDGTIRVSALREVEKRRMGVGKSCHELLPHRGVETIGEA